MSDIKFDCLHCSQHLEAPDDMQGQTIDCPNCNTPIRIPFSDRQEAAPPPSTATEPGDDDSTVFYPWEPDPERLAKAQEYDVAGQVVSYPCKCGEFLNSLLKTETLKALKNAAGDFRVYPNMAVATFREEKPGCVEALIAKAPESLRMLLKIILFPYILLFAMPNLFIGIVMMMIGVGILIAILVGAVVFVLSTPLIAIPAILIGIGVFFGVQWVYGKYRQKRLAIIRQRLATMANRILCNPKSPFAVKTLFKYGPIVPRIWMRGDKVGEVMGIVRISARSKLIKRALVLVIQDNAFGRDGCFSVGMGILLGRLLSKRRRIYVLAFDGGEPAADAAASALADMLDVPVQQGAFNMNRLVVK